MSEQDCIFCKIHRGELPATVVNRADGLLAIEDINPKADVHLLVIPERHIETFRDIGELSETEAKRMLDFVADTAKAAGLDEYRLMVFCGAGRRPDRLPPALAHPRRPDARLRRDEPDRALEGELHGRDEGPRRRRDATRCG